MARRDLTPEEQQKALEMAVKGETRDDVCRALKCSMWQFYEYRKRDLDFAKAFNDAEREGTHATVDELVSIHLEEPDTPRLIARSNNAKWRASRKNPEVFGETMRVEQRVTIDILPVIEAAKQRAAAARVVTPLLPESGRAVVDAHWERLPADSAPDTESGAEGEPVPGEGDIYR